METQQAVIVFYIAIWVGVAVIAAMVGKRGALSWVAALAWTVPAAWLTLIGAWILPDRSVYEPAASVEQSELWPIHLTLAVRVMPFGVALTVIGLVLVASVVRQPTTSLRVPWVVAI